LALALTDKSLDLEKPGVQMPGKIASNCIDLPSRRLRGAGYLPDLRPAAAGLRVRLATASDNG
jgi:hypothetical protein